MADDMTPDDAIKWLEDLLAVAAQTPIVHPRHVEAVRVALAGVRAGAGAMDLLGIREEELRLCQEANVALQRTVNDQARRLSAMADDTPTVEQLRLALDAAEALFAVMANVDMGNWQQTPEWIEAAKRARDRYYLALHATYPPVGPNDPPPAMADDTR